LLQARSFVIKVYNFFKKYLRLLAHFIWPEHCPVCGRVAVSHCTECLESAVSLLDAFCLDCGGSYGVDCCINSVPCYAASLHEGSARKFILNLKYNNAQSLGLPIGRLLGRMLCNPGADVIIPVPLHKESSRNYNQSDMLAEGMAEEWLIPADCGALKWDVETGMQIGKSSYARRAMPQNAMSAYHSFKGSRVFLVDDVYTTGGTLRSARRAVEDAEGIVVGAAVWSRRISSLENEAAWSDVKNINAVKNL
jgi:predicted amidophosphoribosyltransferase